MFGKSLGLASVARLLTALCIALPAMAMAVDYTDTVYAPWSYSAGCVVWRASTDTANFHQSAIADVAADGSIGEAYSLGTTDHPWQVFASNQSVYTEPGLTIVYDGDTYRQSSDSSFSPLSLGGLWVKSLAADGAVYTIAGSSENDRYTDFGSNGVSSYFKFDKSFAISRSSDTRCYGDVTIEVASGATFTDTKTIWSENNGTIKLVGAGTIASSITLNSSSTLDLSAANVPTITGNVTLYDGSTIVLPAGTAPSTESPFPVCSGTLTVGSLNMVKIGDGDAFVAAISVDDGKITEISPRGQTFTSDFPHTVPVGWVYTFVGGDTAANVVAVNDVEISGTLKTTGFITLTDVEVKNGGTLDIVSGNANVTAKTNGDGDKLITGNLTVEAGATLTVSQGDFLDYYNVSSQRVDIYGTVALGNTRWSINSFDKVQVNLYPGAVVTGSGDEHGAFDLYTETSKLNVYRGDAGGEVVIEGKLRTRNANTPIWVAADTILKVGAFNGGGINKSGDGTLQISGTITGGAASTVSEGTIAFVDTTAALPLAVNAGKTVTATASDGVTVPLNATLAASANITVSGEGTVNGTVTFGGIPSGTLTGLTTATWTGTVSVPAGSGNLSNLANCGNAGSVIDFAGTTDSSYIMASGGKTYNVGAININGATVLDNGSSGSTVNFAKVSGAGALTLAGWAGCSSARYNLNSIDGYTGALTIANNITRNEGGTFTIGIGNIVNENTAAGACVLPFTKTAADNATGTVVINIDNATLNGAAVDLEVREDGIYVAEPTSAAFGAVTVTYGSDTNATVVAAVTGAGDFASATYTLTTGGNSYTGTYSAGSVTFTVPTKAGSALDYTISATSGGSAIATDAAGSSHWVDERKGGASTGTWTDESDAQVALDYGEDDWASILNNSFAPTTPSAGDVVTTEMVVRFTGVRDDVDEVNDEVQAALRLGDAADPKFMVWTYTNAENKAWVPVTAAGVPLNAANSYEHTIRVTFAYTNKTYTIEFKNGDEYVTAVGEIGGEAVTAFPLANKTKSQLTKVNFNGTGSLKSLLGDYSSVVEELFKRGDILQLVDDKIMLTDVGAAWLNGLEGDDYATAKAWVETLTAAQFNTAYLLNVKGGGSIAVTEVSVDGTSVTLKVLLDRDGIAPLDVREINGTLKIYGGDALALAGFEDLGRGAAIADDNDDKFSRGNQATVIYTKGEGEEKFFFQPKIEGDSPADPVDGE